MSGMACGVPRGQQQKTYRAPRHGVARVTAVTVNRWMVEWMVGLMVGWMVGFVNVNSSDGQPEN